MITTNGLTNSATWIDDPIDTPMARSTLFLAATVTAVTYSAVLPAMGRMIRPMKDSEIRVWVTISLMVSTRKSAQKATRTEELARRTNAAVLEMGGLSISFVRVMSMLRVGDRETSLLIEGRRMSGVVDLRGCCTVENRDSEPERDRGCRWECFVV